MKPSLIMITGWAHGPESLQPLADLLAADFDVRVLAGAQVLADGKIPDADYIIGWSMGGMLAIEQLPVSCKKLILISSTARFCSTDGYDCGVPEKLLRRMMVHLQSDPDAVLAAFYKNVNYPQLPDGNICPAENLADGLNYLLHADLRAKVPAIGIPVLLLNGREDLIIPPAASEWLAENLPNARLSRLETSGHKPEAPTVYPLIHHFLTREEP
jgi:pimeloyl-ACP methyl ester carboxylesterase